MKLLLSVCLAVLFSNLALAIQVGDSQADVTAAMGKPSLSRQTANGAAVWRFKDGTTVRFEKGVVAEITEPATRSPHDTGSVRTPDAPRGTPTRTTPSARPTSTSENVTNSYVTNDNVAPSTTAAESPRSRTMPDGTSRGGPYRMRPLGYLLLGLGIVVAILCRIMLLVVAFRAGIVWFLVSIFVPFGGLIFVLTHWSDCKKWVWWQLLIAVPLIAVAIMLTPP